MDTLNSIFWWFAGGAQRPYHALSMCMNRDYFWITVTVSLDLLVAIGYVLIAYHWSKNEKLLPQSPARAALRTMRNIFIFCGICGYLFIPVKMFWPAWRLYDMFMVGLVFYTWRYALNARNLKVIYTAIGESKQLAEDLAKIRDESKRKSFFLNAISHDLRTPLNGMLLHINLAELQFKSDPAAAQKSVLEIKAGIKTTAEMLDGLLEYAKLETAVDVPVMSDVELSGVFASVLSHHRAAAEKKSIHLDCQPSDRLILRTDRLSVERILNNLIGNAIKFTKSGSVTVSVNELPDVVEICVADTGIGIAEGDQGRLFEEFFQVHNKERDRQKGFGLGLAICQRLVHQIGGTLVFQSKLGEGSKFVLTLNRFPDVKDVSQFAARKCQPPVSAKMVLATIASK